MFASPSLFAAVRNFKLLFRTKRLSMARYSCNLISMRYPPPPGLHANHLLCVLICTKLVRNSWGLLGMHPVRPSPHHVMLNQRGMKLRASMLRTLRIATDSSSVPFTKMPSQLCLTPASAGPPTPRRAALMHLISTISGTFSGPPLKMLLQISLRPTAPLLSSFGAEPRSWSGRPRHRGSLTGLMGTPSRAIYLTGSLPSGGRPTDASGWPLCLPCVPSPALTPP